jgi:putative intracellular protease/amidase
MSDRVHTAIYDGMPDWEVALAVAHINSPQWQREPGRFRVMTVGETGKDVTTMGGMRIAPDLVVDQLRPADSAMLILPGADSWLEGGNAVFADTARDYLAAGVLVAAICGATAGLARAGLLDDRDHTSNAPAFLGMMPGYHGAERYRHEPAVNDRGLITASATAPVEFAREILACLGLYEPNVLASWYKLYGSQDPEGYDELLASASR